MKTVALVLAGGEGSRLYPLTADHAKPALAFANGYRIVDFVLSNLVNSRISTIYVLAQYKPDSLIQHIQTAWAPSFGDSGGFIKVLLPRSNTLGGQFKGTADAVYQYLDLLQAHAPDIVAVFAADHVYRMDVQQMSAFHLERGADVTVAAVPVPIGRASSFGIMTADPGDGRVRAFREKPRHPAPMPGDPTRAYASMGNYLFAPRVLERLLLEARARGETDFGRDILPRLCRDRVYAYDFSSNVVPGVQEHEERAYWRDVGTLSALAAAQQDAMGQPPRFDLRNRRWPIRGAYEALLARSRPQHGEAQVEIGVAASGFSPAEIARHGGALHDAPAARVAP